MNEWSVYVLVSKSVERTYVGITTDMTRRLEQHNGELPGGASSTRSGRPWRVGAVSGAIASRGKALQIEYRVKASTGMERVEIVRGLSADDLL